MGKPKKHQSADAVAGEVNLETKDEGELVSIGTVKQMLDVQQSMLKTLFDSFISTVNARVDKLADSVASLKASHEFTQKCRRFVVLKIEARQRRKGYCGNKKQCGTLWKQSIEYQENQSRRNNIRVFGIPELAGETCESAETKVKYAIMEKLNIEVDIERTHRVERSVATIHSFPVLLMM